MSYSNSINAPNNSMSLHRKGFSHPDQFLDQLFLPSLYRNLCRGKWKKIEIFEAGTYLLISVLVSIVLALFNVSTAVIVGFPVSAVYGVIFFKLRFTLKRSAVFVCAFWIVPAVLSVSFQSSKSVFFAVIPLIASFFAVLRGIRQRLTEKIGLKNSGLLTITIYLIVYITTGVAACLHIATSQETIVYMLIGPYILLIALLWYCVHKLIYVEPPDPIKDKVLKSENDLSLQVLLKELSSSQIVTGKHKRIHMIASGTILFAMICVEITTTCLLVKYYFWEGSEEIFWLACVVMPGAPIFTIIGAVFSGSSLRKNDKFCGGLLVSSIVCLVTTPLAYKLFEIAPVASVILCIGTSASLVYWLALSLLSHYNKAAYQVYSGVFCLTFALPFGFALPLYYSELISEQDFWVFFSLFFVGTFLALLVYFAVLRIKKKKFHFLQVNFEISDVALYLFSFCFLVGTCALYFFYWRYLGNDWISGMLAGSIGLMLFCGIGTVIVHRVRLYIKEPGLEKPSLAAVLLAEYIETPLGKMLLKKKKKLQKFLFFFSTICILAVIPYSSFMNSTSNRNFFCGYFAISILISALSFILLLELKLQFKQYSKTVLSYFFVFCWVFFLFPLICILPIFISLISSQDLKTITSWLIGCICILFMTGISTISIGINGLFKRLEYEKLAKHCCLRVKKELSDIGVKIDLDTLRLIFDELCITSPEKIEEVLKEKTVFSYWELPENFYDFRFSKEILTVEELERAKNKKKFMVDVVVIDEENNEEYSCWDMIVSLCSSEKEEKKENFGEVLQMEEFDGLGEEKLQEIEEGIKENEIRQSGMENQFVKQKESLCIKVNLCNDPLPELFNQEESIMILSDPIRKTQLHTHYAPIVPVSPFSSKSDLSELFQDQMLLRQSRNTAIASKCKQQMDLYNPSEPYKINSEIEPYKINSEIESYKINSEIESYKINSEIKMLQPSAEEIKKNHFKNLKNVTEARKNWFKIVFLRFAHGANSDLQGPWMTVQDLREFVRLVISM